MKQWYVKDLSAITGISGQTLHHYDRIGLLTPSVRLANGYRLYSEQDLLKLQQIMALKYFGFELNKIKALLDGQIHMQDHLIMQAQLLKEKSDALLTASNTLSTVLSHCEGKPVIPWKSVIQLIEVFRVTHELEKSWAGKIFTPEELNQYAHFKSGLKLSLTKNKLKQFEKSWIELSDTIQSQYLGTDPQSPAALEIAQKAMSIINGLYGKENANLRHKVWEEGIKTGTFGNSGMTREGALWLDQAFHAYYRQRILFVLNLVPHLEANEIKAQWNALLEDMFGDSQPLKQAVINAALVDDAVSEEARRWLKQQG